LQRKLGKQISYHRAGGSSHGESASDTEKIKSKDSP